MNYVRVLAIVWVLLSIGGFCRAMDRGGEHDAKSEFFESKSAIRPPAEEALGMAIERGDVLALRKAIGDRVVTIENAAYFLWRATNARSNALKMVHELFWPTTPCFQFVLVSPNAVYNGRSIIIDAINRRHDDADRHDLIEAFIDAGFDAHALLFGADEGDTLLHVLVRNGDSALAEELGLLHNFDLAIGIREEVGVRSSYPIDHRNAAGGMRVVRAEPRHCDNCCCVMSFAITAALVALSFFAYLSSLST